MRDFVRRIESATPADRDRAVDALRGIAILGVVLGHWLVTALVVDSGTVHGASPLRYLPGLTPASWLFQTLAVFFLVGGLVGAKSHACARSRGESYGRWLRARMSRIAAPAGRGAGRLDRGGLRDARLRRGPGHRAGTVQAGVVPALVPRGLRGADGGDPACGEAPSAVAVRRRTGRRPLPVRPGRARQLRRGQRGAYWLVPYCLGAAWSRGELHSRRTGWTLLLGGAAATAALVLWAGYPATMVGVPGVAVSNLDPPTLAVVTFGLAQCGAALLLIGPLRRALRRPALWAVVATLNLSAMTVFLWHQTAMIAVTATGLWMGGTLPGLHTVPDEPGWVLARLAWLPAFAAALLICRLAFRGYERQRPTRTKSLVVRGGRPARPEAARRVQGPSRSLLPGGARHDPNERPE